MKRVVYGKSGDFILYNLKIVKTWNGNLSFERGMEMWNISRQFLFFASPSLCSNCMSLIYFIHLLYPFVLCSVFASNIFSIICLIHRSFASFFQNNCIFRKLSYSLKFWTVKKPHAHFSAKIQKKSVGKSWVFEIQILK